MKNLKDIVFIIQARMGSQRVPGKMLRDFAGTNLMDVAIDKITSSKVIPQDQFYVSAYEEEIKEVCNNKGVNIFHRSKESADSEGTPMSVMYEWWDKLPYKYCILINACAPFLKIQTIESFCDSYINCSNDGMFGVIERKDYYWNSKGSLVTPWPDGQAVMNTKFVEQTFQAAHCLYAGKMEKINKGIWMGDFQKSGDIKLFPMDEQECFDIDHNWQFQTCELLYKGGLR